jgi:hypothetical protein
MSALLCVVLRHTRSISMAQHNTDLKRAPYKRSILGNLPKAAKVMPYTVALVNFSGSFGICH